MAEPTLDAVRAAISGLRAERLEQGQTRLRVDLSERTDRLQAGLDALRQEYAVDWANVDRGTRIPKGASDEVRALGDQVNAFTKLAHMLEAQIRDLRANG